MQRTMPNWDAYNEMIGLGWRPANFGDCIKWEVLKNKPYVACVDCSSGHGSRHPFQVVVRKLDHPIMKDIPSTWMHGKDELYHNMRGPAKNLSILSSAYSNPKQGGTVNTSPSLMKSSTARDGLSSPPWGISGRTRLIGMVFTAWAFKRF